MVWEELLETPEVQEMIEGEMAALLEGGKHYEYPRAFKLLGEPFSIENGFLTPKLSLKRMKVQRVFQSTLDGLYK